MTYKVVEVSGKFRVMETSGSYRMLKKQFATETSAQKRIEQLEGRQ